MNTNININIEDIYYKKYIKYKTKYLELKEQSGGMFGFLKSKSKAPIAYVAHVPAKEYVNN